VADTLSAAGSYLQEKKVEHVAGDVADLIQRYPIPSLLIGLGIGYFLARSTREVTGHGRDLPGAQSRA
jgi:hypothetical protein